MLKHLTKALAVGLLGVAPGAWAGGRLPTSIVDVNLMSPVLGKATLEYEVALGGAATVVVGPQLNLIQNVPGLTGVNGFGGFAGLHLFPGGLAVSGIWMGPEVSFGYVGQTAASGPGIYAQLDGLVGYNFFPADHLALCIGLGGGYHFSSIQVNGSTASASTNGFGFAGRLGLGYGW